MKNINSYIIEKLHIDKDIKCDENLLTEHFVNCKDESEMKQYGNIVWKILQKAYE